MSTTLKVEDVRDEFRRPWTLRRVLAIAGQVGIAFLLATVFLGFIAQGLVAKFPDRMGPRLSKAIPGFAWTASYEETKNLRIAHLWAAVLISVLFYCEKQIIRLLVVTGGRPTREGWLVLGVGSLLLLFDAVLMYFGITATQDGGGVASAVMLTTMYALVLVVLSLWVVKLERGSR